MTLLKDALIVVAAATAITIVGGEALQDFLHPRKPNLYTEDGKYTYGSNSGRSYTPSTTIPIKPRYDYSSDGDVDGEQDPHSDHPAPGYDGSFDTGSPKKEESPNGLP
jgi:hypothetical protein